MNVPPVLQVNQQLLLQLSSKLGVHHSSFMILIKQLAGFFFFFFLKLHFYAANLEQRVTVTFIPHIYHPVCTTASLKSKESKS